MRILEQTREQEPFPTRDADAFRWAWAALLALLTLLFFLSYFNRFAGLRSGNGEFTTGLWFLRGQIPYRDYFSATPPLNALKSALWLKMFGPWLLVSRAAGVMERVVIALVSFRWLCKLFPARFAFAGSLVTIVVSAGDAVDPIASYNHDAILWAMLSGFAASFVLDSPRPRLLLFWPAMSGLFAGLCLITKQTIGVGAAIAVPAIVAVLLVNSRAYRSTVTWLTGFIAGCAIPVSFLGLWLHHFHLWRSFLTMAFLKGPAAKGGHAGDFLRREIMAAETNWFLVLLALIAIGLSAAAILRVHRERELEVAPRSEAMQKRDILRLGVGFGLAIVSAELLGLTRLGALRNLSKAAVYFVFLVAACFLVAYGVQALRGVLPRKQRQFALFVAVSFFVAFFLSLSWPVFEAMALPGLAFLIAVVLQGARPKNRRLVYVFLGALVFLQVREKLTLPFGFDGLNESPVREAVEPSRLPELRGMRFSPDMNAFLEGTVETIRTHSTRADTILTYPEMSLFYVLSDRTYPTISGSHNVDVVNDSFAAEEAARILNGRPAVVVYMKLTPDEVAHQDMVWRFGKPSGQHILVAAIERLTKSYRIASVYRVGPGAREIVVYVRQ